MRKYIMLFIVLCLHGLARGQTSDYTGFYWFDNQQGTPAILPTAEGSFDVDASSLPDGVHAFHYVVALKDGGISSPFTSYFVKLNSVDASLKGFYWFDNQQGYPSVLSAAEGSFNVDASALSYGLHTFHYVAALKDGGLSSPFTSYFVRLNSIDTSLKGFYWFDDQQGRPSESPTTEGTFEVDASALSDGLHAFHYVASQSEVGISSPFTGYFLKMFAEDASLKGFYWFDDEPVAYEAPNLNGLFNVDVSSLSDGFHRFSFIASQSGSGLANPSTCYFLKIAQVSEDDSLTCLCSVDRQLKHVEKLSQQGGVIHWDLDMLDIPDGIHHIQLQAVTKSGALSNSFGTYFMRLSSHEELNEMRCVYAIDGSSINSNSNVVGHDGSYHFDLDLSDLEEGLHYITFLLNNDRGTSTMAQTRFFIKTPVGGNGIKQYQYWLNDESIEQAKTVTLQEKVNPLQLMSLLPVESRPLRSSQFHFDISSGKPMVYAKNTIHLRFYDVAMRFSDATKDYADYSQSQEVNVIKTLESGVRETTGWPEENQIKWYSVTAERGDSLSFKTDLAATLQLFSPSGKEVYLASGYEVLQWDGCHAEEDGTYYLALHDVTATEGEAISIDYEHIDRYAVLRQDVDVVGNAGYSTITFEGNGFDELTSVELIQNATVMQPVEIGHESKATTTVKFDFDSAQLGEYKAVFHFLEGEITIEKCITIEEATPIELDVKADFARQYLISFHKTKYVFSIHNYGNVTAYNVPLMIRIYTHTAESIERIDIEGYDLEKKYRDYWGAYYNDTIADFVKSEKEKSGDRCFFVETDSTDIVAGWAAHVHETFILPNIPPNSTIDIGVNLQLGQAVYCYMWCPKDWNNDKTAIGHKRRAADSCNISWWLIHKWRCYQNELHKRYVDERNRRLREAGLDDDLLGYNFPYPNEDCSDESRPGCNPPTGGGSNPGGGVDPNDIFGYLSEAESKFMTDSVARVTYTIEYENDPEFATAAAHEIFVTDTLDATKFDLSTFAPSQINIGRRSIELNGEKNFIKTVDMRPEINAIAQVEGTFNEKKGIAQWHISSLDPMTMEPTDDVMQGILPVNYDGTSGIGEVMFNIGLKQPLPDGTEVPNRASIIFDKNEAILTPTWTNIVDAVAPSSSINDSWMVNDSTLRITADGFDARSGVWKYVWYVQAGENAPWWKEGETNEASFDYHIYEGIDYGFCVLAVDSAGNVEQKVVQRERGFKTYGQDYEDNISPLPASHEDEKQVFDLSGRKHEEPQEGINIINRKKMLFRRKGK